MPSLRYKNFLTTFRYEKLIATVSKMVCCGRTGIGAEKPGLLEEAPAEVSGKFEILETLNRVQGGAGATVAAQIVRRVLTRSMSRLTAAVAWPESIRLFPLVVGGARVGKPAGPLFTNTISRRGSWLVMRSSLLSNTV